MNHDRRNSAGSYFIISDVLMSCQVTICAFWIQIPFYMGTQLWKSLDAKRVVAAEQTLFLRKCGLM